MEIGKQSHLNIKHIITLIYNYIKIHISSLNELIMSSSGGGGS